jgi:hypothetical protein
MMNIAFLFTPGGPIGKAAKELVLAERETFLYQKLSATGAHLKFGITVNTATRYSAKQMAGGTLREFAQGTRKEMLALERELHRTLPLGPEERRVFYRLYQFVRFGK